MSLYIETSQPSAQPESTRSEANEVTNKPSTSLRTSFAPFLHSSSNRLHGGLPTFLLGAVHVPPPKKNSQSIPARCFASGGHAPESSINEGEYLRNGRINPNHIQFTCQPQGKTKTN